MKEQYPYSELPWPPKQDGHMQVTCGKDSWSVPSSQAELGNQWHRVTNVTSQQAGTLSTARRNRYSGTAEIYVIGTNLCYRPGDIVQVVWLSSPPLLCEWLKHPLLPAGQFETCFTHTATSKIHKLRLA